MNSTFEEIYEQYGEMLYRIAYVYMGNPYDTEDALQEVFVKFLSKSPKFKSNEHEKAWLIRVTINQCKNMLKSSARKNHSLNEAVIPASIVSSDLKLDVFNKVMALTPKYKTVIILYYYYDFSLQDISNTLGISLSGVKTRLKRAKDMLKTDLEVYNK